MKPYLCTVSINMILKKSLQHVSVQV